MKSAKEMFSELGFEYSECYFEGKLDSILYKGKQKRHIQVEFMLDRKLYKVFFETCTKETYDILPSCIDMKLHNAINKQVEELGWNDTTINIDVKLDGKKVMEVLNRTNTIKKVEE